MRRRAALIAAALLALAGCSDTGGSSEAPPVERVTVSFEKLADVVVVHALDRLPLHGAVLVAPDGERVSAYSLDVVSSPQIQPGLGEAELLSTPGAIKRTTRLDTMVSTALIRLPDPAQYAKSWREWRVALSFGDPGTAQREVTIAAPKPPG